MKITKTIRLICLLFFLVPLAAFAQSVSVKGIVKDAKGEPLIGVNVIEVGSSVGTITDINGSFALKVSSTAKLKVSYLGYQTSVVAVDGKTNLNVVLQDDNKVLDEVVVVGYGTQRKEAVTGSVASVKGDVMREVQSSDITRALQGRISGVDMEQTSTKPGSSMQIRIRGTRSLNASNDPLVVLDGIPFSGSISDISTSDIKSVDILKDASATAIYGSRGANGVIMITTNKGLKGQKAQITYNGYYGTKDVFGKYPMMNGTEFVALRKAAGLYTNSLDESNEINTDWQDLLYRKGTLSSHDIGIAGGTEKSNYKFGIGYYKDEAVLPGQDFSRISLRASLDQEVGKFVKIGFTSNNNFSINNGNNMGVYGALNSSPIANPYNADGSLKKIIRMPMEDQWVFTRESVNGLGDKWIDQTKAYGSYNTVYAEVKIPGVDGLKYRVNMGLNFRQSSGGSYTGEGVFSSIPTSVSTASISNSLNTNWAIENLLTYDRAFGKHNLNLTALYSAEENFYNRSYISAKDIPADAFQFYNLGRAVEQPIIDPNNQYYNMSGLTSGMGRVMYSYDSRYMFTASFRADGSSRLAEGHKWVSYPALSAGWNIANESFMKDIQAINSLKLRVGYGVASNQSIDPYSTLGRLGTRPYNFGTSNATGFYVTELPNPNLGWEYSSTMNYGLDFGVLNNRLTGTFEYYETKTSDLLFRVGLPSTSGVNNYMANVGSSENKGMELSLNGVILDNLNGWTWELGVNVYTNHNKLTSLASGQLKDESNNWFVGSPIDVIYDYKNIGIWQEGDANLKKFEPDGNVGMVKVEYTGNYYNEGDVIPNGRQVGDPVRAIGAADRQILSMESKFQGGFNSRVAYKGFDLSIVGAFKSGGLLIATPYGANGYLNILSGRRGNIKVDYWTPENTGAKFPKPGGVGGDQPKYLNTLSYMDASYVKIRTITLGYNFESSKWFKTTGLNKMRIYCTVQNPFVMFSPYYKLSGMDPESNSYGNENAAVPMSYNLRRLLTIGTSTPATRNYLIGLNITF
jgi:TonB-linked SusC/RagA family outer membrane protein